MQENGNIFELINEECYYDDLWFKEKEEEDNDKNRQ